VGHCQKSHTLQDISYCFITYSHHITRVKKKCRNLWNSTRDSTLGKMNPLYSFTSYFSTIHFNTVLPFIHRSNKLLSWVSWPIFCKDFLFLSHVFRVSRAFHSSWFNHPNNIRYKVKMMKLFIMKFSPVSCYFISLRSKYHPLHLFFKSFNAYSSFTMRNRLATTYRQSRHSCQ
jgi:hypothetical protein